MKRYVCSATRLKPGVNEKSENQFLDELLITLNPFTAKLKTFNRNFVSISFKVRPFPFSREGVEKLPTHHSRHVIIEQDHKAVSPVGDSVQNVLVPVLQLRRFCHATLQRDISKLGPARQLARNKITTFAILNTVNLSA